MEDGQKDIFSFQIQRAISAISKSFLNLLEDLQEEYDRYFDKGQYSTDESLGLPENFLSEEHFNHLRKRILDRGGEATRELLEELDKYKMRLLTNEEFEEQARNRLQ